MLQKGIARRRLQVISSNRLQFMNLQIATHDMQQENAA
jgi:hypothetical protein